MLTIITYIIASFITVPILVTYIIYQIGIFFNKSSIRSFHHSVHLTTILYILSTHALVKMLFDTALIGIIFIFILITLSISIIIQWKKDVDISLKRAMKITWRLCFLIFSVTYILLTLGGIIYQIYTS